MPLEVIMSTIMYTKYRRRTLAQPYNPERIQQSPYWLGSHIQGTSIVMVLRALCWIWNIFFTTNNFFSKIQLKWSGKRNKNRHTKYKDKYCCVRFDRNKITLSNWYKSFQWFSINFYASLTKDRLQTVDQHLSPPILWIVLLCITAELQPLANMWDWEHWRN
jgi:hypothetical protein